MYIACASHADMCLCAMPPCARAAARRVQAAAPCPMNVPRIPGAASRGYTYYASQARLAAEDAQPWYNSEAQKPQALRQGVGKYIAQSTWEQAHAPAPRWGGGGGGGSSSGGGAGGGGGASARALEAAEEMAGEQPAAKKSKREAKGFGDFSGW